MYSSLSSSMLTSANNPYPFPSAFKDCSVEDANMTECEDGSEHFYLKFTEQFYFNNTKCRTAKSFSSYPSRRVTGSFTFCVLNLVILRKNSTFGSYYNS